MPIAIGALLSFLGSILGKLLTDSMLKFVAWKIFFFTILTVSFPIVMKNLLCWLFDVLVSAVGSIDMGDMTSVVVELSGFTAYLATHLQLVECVSIILTAVAIRLALNFIPFVG